MLACFMIFPPHAYGFAWFDQIILEREIKEASRKMNYKIKIDVNEMVFFIISEEIFKTSYHGVCSSIIAFF